MDGQEVLKQIRALEKEFDIPPEGTVKVIMTTALDDRANLAQALPRCDAYLTKPIDKTQLMYYIRSFGLLDADSADEAREKERKRHAHEGESTGNDEMPWVG
jgi:CheY-like chemotaxis protein